MFKDILVPVDLGHIAESAQILIKAQEMAEQCGARIHVITVIPDFGMTMVASFFPDDYEKKAMTEGEKALKAFTAEHGKGRKIDQHIVGHGSVYKEIVRTAKKTGCDLIIMGSGARDDAGYLVGHNSARVMRHSKCSVLLLR